MVRKGVKDPERVVEEGQGRTGKLGLGDYAYLKAGARAVLQNHRCSFSFCIIQICMKLIPRLEAQSPSCPPCSSGP